MYASYLLIQSVYVMQAISLGNIAVFVVATGCNICRAVAEEQLLSGSPAYRAYQGRVRGRDDSPPVVRAQEQMPGHALLPPTGFGRGPWDQP